MQFCAKYRASVEWKANKYHMLTVPEQGIVLGRVYRQSNTQRSYRSGGSKSRKRQLEDASAAKIREYATWLREELLHINRSSKKQHQRSEAEINALITHTSNCAHEILRRWAARKPGNTIPSTFDIESACTLARKTIFGYDVPVYIKGEKEGRYDSWIVQFLQQNDWKPCVEEQRKCGEMPLLHKGAQSVD